MSNLSITARCNRRCSYCFAMESLNDLRSPSMPFGLYERTLDFLQRSGLRQVPLLGGEPTLHPKFAPMLDRALERGFTLLVFSGGLIPPRALAKLASLPHDKIQVGINVVPPGGNEREIARQAAVYRVLGDKVCLGLNIDRPSVMLDFMLELIQRYNLHKSVRLGLAHPIHGGSNDYLHPREYPEVGRRVADFAVRARQQGVQLHFDCGWVPCMFPPDSVASLGEEGRGVGLHCIPVPDTLVDGRMISCYALASLASLAMTESEDANSARRYFEQKQHGDRVFMLYPECQACGWRARGLCTGGCLAGSMKRLRSAPFTVTAPASPPIAITADSGRNSCPAR